MEGKPCPKTTLAVFVAIFLPLWMNSRLRSTHYKTSSRYESRGTPPFPLIVTDRGDARKLTWHDTPGAAGFDVYASRSESELGVRITKVPVRRRPPKPRRADSWIHVLPREGRRFYTVIAVANDRSEVGRSVHASSP